MSTTAVTLTTKPTKRMEGIGPDGPERLNLNVGEQFRFVFDARACIGCHSCEAACANQNGLPPDTAWRRVGELEGGTFPDTTKLFLSMACNHCLEPACLTGCPTNAYIKLDNGVVQHQADECIGCQYCTWNCPYSVPVFQPDRRIVTKCDLCQPRLEVGMEPACVSACPTRALSIEAVNVEAWRADPSAGNAPNLPDVGLTLSTTRIILPDNLPADTVAASDHRIRPEHPHWPLVWLTLFTQWAAGTSAAVTLAQLTGHEARAGALVAALVGAVALVASLGHLGRPGLAWKALRNVRRSWLSREALMFALYGPLAALHALASMLGTGAAAVGVLATLVGIAGVVSSAALYVVPGRPAWHTRLTFPTFLLVAVGAGAATAVGAGALPAVALVVTAVAVLAQLGVWAANLFRLQRDGRREARGTLVLLRVRFARLAQLRVLAGVAAVGTALAGWPLPALALLLISEFVGRYLFFVTVVPLNMPGSFWREAR